MRASPVALPARKAQPALRPTATSTACASRLPLLPLLPLLNSHPHHTTRVPIHHRPCRPQRDAVDPDPAFDSRQLVDRTLC